MHPLCPDAARVERHELCFVDGVVRPGIEDERQEDEEDEEGELSLAAEEPRDKTSPSPGAASYVAKTRRWALVIVVLASFAAAAWVAHPLWVAILLGVMMALSTHRPFEALKRVLGDRRAAWAAAIVTLGSGLLLAVAGTLTLFALANELMKLVGHIEPRGKVGSLAGLIGERAASAVSEVGIDTQSLYGWIEKELEAAASYIATTAALVARTASYAMLGLVVSLMTMYYVLLEGPKLARRIERLAPLEPRHTRALIGEAREVGRDAFVGTLATAVIQGVLAGIGYAVLGVPEPVTWAIATAIASFLPLVGTLLVWVPISGYLAFTGHPVRAVLLLAWGILVVTSLADYVIRPRIVGARSHVHPLLTLIALLGGIEVFGLAGLVVAPIAMSVFVAAFHLYERELRATNFGVS